MRYVWKKKIQWDTSTINDLSSSYRRKAFVEQANFKTEGILRAAYGVVIQITLKILWQPKPIMEAIIKNGMKQTEKQQKRILEK